MARPINLLFIFADQMRGQAMGCAGTPPSAPRTSTALPPRASGRRTPSPPTPSAAPLQASLLTGNHVFRNGMSSSASCCPSTTAASATCSQMPDMPRGMARKVAPRRRTGGVSRLLAGVVGGFDDAWAVCNCDHNYFQHDYYTDSPEPASRSTATSPTIRTDLAMEFIRARRQDPFCLFVSCGTRTTRWSRPRSGSSVVRPDAGPSAAQCRR